MSNFVKVYRNKSSVVNDAFDNAVFNLCMNKERHGYKMFYLCGCEPRVGTTSVAVELSISLSVSGWKTLLLDGDLRKGNDYKRLNEEAFVGLADYINGKVSEDQIIHATNWDNLKYISCGNIGDDNPLKMLYSARMADLIQSLNEKFEYIIIDGPALSSSVDSGFYSLRSDATVLVAAMDGSHKKYLEQAYRRLIKNDANVIGVIENKVSMKEYRQYTKDYDYFNDKKFVNNSSTQKKITHNSSQNTTNPEQSAKAHANYSSNTLKRNGVSKKGDNT